MSHSGEFAARLLDALSRLREVVGQERAHVQAAGAAAFAEGRPDDAMRLASDLRALTLASEATDEYLTQLQGLFQFTEGAESRSSTTDTSETPPTTAEAAELEKPSPLPQPGLESEPPMEGLALVASDLGHAGSNGHAAAAVASQVVESVPAANPAPVEPAPRPRTGRKWKEDCRRFFEGVRSLEGIPTWSPVDLCRMKRLVCQGRALIEHSQQDPAEADHVKEDIARLRTEFDRRHEDLDFFGFNLGRRHGEEQWKNLADVYEALESAFECWAWLANDDADAIPEYPTLLSGIAACESWLYRVVQKVDPPIVDLQARSLHGLVEGVKPEDLFVKWWQTHGEGAPSDAEVRTAALNFAKEWPVVRDRHDKIRAKRASLQHLRRVTSAEGDEFNPDDFLAAVRDAVAAGVPPSDRELISLCYPYMAFVMESPDDRALAKVAGYLLQRYQTSEGQREFNEGEGDESELEVAEDGLGAARQFLRDKRLLFIGGRKGQTQRRDHYLRALELKDLIWDDAEDGTHVARLAERIEAADGVFQLVRWSRHSYGDLLKKAKDQGKPVVRLTHGLGLNTVLHQVQEQLRLGARIG